MFNYKITDLKFHIDNLVPKDVCKYFIEFYENNNQYVLPEQSYKFKSKKIELDNFSCINLTQLCEDDKKFYEPLDLAKKYITLMVTNYSFYIQKKMCSNFDTSLISKSSNIRILKYEKGQFIKDHSDVGTINRASCTLNLNEDYKGGEFRFFSGKLKYSFKTGDAILFPAEPIWIHGTEPITEGTRYCINCFLHP